MKVKTEKQATLFSVRPALVADLMAAGCEVRETPNVMNPERRAWLIPIDPVSAEIVRDYYSEKGLPLPERVAQFIAENREA